MFTMFNNLLIFVNSQMAYFQRNEKKNAILQRNVRYGENSLEETKGNSDIKKGSESKHSYLKAFKKYYIEKLLDNKRASSDHTNQENKEHFQINQINSRLEKHPQPHQRSILTPTENEKSSIMTDSTKNSRQKSTVGKISRSKIVNLVQNNDQELQELYSSITQIQRQMGSYGETNDLVRENKLLKSSISRLKQILKQKLEGALKKNKEELTSMFDEYSNMIRKLLEDKETLTNHLDSWKEKYQSEERRWQNIQSSYENKIAIIVEENNTQISNTKRQIEQFLEMIIQYEEESNKEKMELQNLRERVVELEMENDGLKNERDSFGNSCKSSTLKINQICEEKLDQYAEKIESLLAMIEQLQSQNEELNQFLKSCKCSRIKSDSKSRESLQSNQSMQQIIQKYEKKLIQAEKDYIKEEIMLREVMKKKDECIQRLNLIIGQLRKARYASVDRMTEEALERQLLQIKSL